MSLMHEKRAALPKATLLPTERYGHRPSVNPVESNNTRPDSNSRLNAIMPAAFAFALVAQGYIAVALLVGGLGA